MNIHQGEKHEDRLSWDPLAAFALPEFIAVACNDVQTVPDDTPAAPVSPLVDCDGGTFGRGTVLAAPPGTRRRSIQLARALVWPAARVWPPSARAC